MAKNLVNGTNIIIEENGDNINLDLSSTYTSELEQTINDSFKENNIYSTTETVIGKWIDNKPIYRKVVSGTFTSSNSRVSVDLIVNADTLINVEGVWSPNSATPNICYGSPEISTTGRIDGYFQLRKNSYNTIQLLECTPTYGGSTGSYSLAIYYTKL